MTKIPVPFYVGSPSIPTIKQPDVLSTALKVFGLEWLSLLLKLFDDVREESGFGDLRIVICNGKIESIKKLTSYKRG
jgi:hypothetical protein